MEKIFPFLSEDVLFLIHEFALERTEKKELNKEILNHYLKKKLLELSLNNRSVNKVLSIEFKDYNEFINIVISSVYMDVDTYDFECTVPENNYILYKTIPFGTRLKIYHYFINNSKFNTRFAMDLYDIAMFDLYAN